MQARSDNATRKRGPLWRLFCLLQSVLGTRILTACAATFLGCDPKAKNLRVAYIRNATSFADYNWRLWQAWWWWGWVSNPELVYPPNKIEILFPITSSSDPPLLCLLPVPYGKPLYHLSGVHSSRPFWGVYIIVIIV